MFTAYVVITTVTILATAASAIAVMAKAPTLLANIDKVGVPRSSLPLLVALKAAGAVGLLLGLLGAPVIGFAAGAGLVAFFVGAIVTHIRAHVLSNIAYPGAFLTAVQRGDIAGLVTLLDPNVTRTADPQVVPPGASQVVHGAQAVASEARTFRAGASRAQVAVINGRPGIVIRSARGLHLAMTFRLAQGRVVPFDVVADSHRLARLRIDD
jgi:hypothetical protein